MRKVLLLLIGYLMSFNSYANNESIVSNVVPALPISQTAYKLKNLMVDEQGFTYNTSTDGFLSLGGFDLPRSQACNLVLDFEFKDPMFRPGLFEVFWATDPAAFSEKQKARFLISHENTKKPTVFVIPLCKLYSFSGNLSKPHHQRNIVGLRLDYPMNRVVAIKLSELKLYSDNELVVLRQSMTEKGRDIVELEPFERLSGTAFRSFDVAIPKVYFGIENGLSRLVNDLPFLLFWLLLIFVFIALIVRSFPARG